MADAAFPVASSTWIAKLVHLWVPVNRPRPLHPLRVGVPAGQNRVARTARRGDGRTVGRGRAGSGLVTQPRDPAGLEVSAPDAGRRGRTAVSVPSVTVSRETPSHVSPAAAPPSAAAAGGTRSSRVLACLRNSPEGPIVSFSSAVVAHRSGCRRQTRPTRLRSRVPALLRSLGGTAWDGGRSGASIASLVSRETSRPRASPSADYGPAQAPRWCPART